MRHRWVVRALAGIGASGLALTGLVVVGLVNAPSAQAAAPPGTPWTWGENAYGQLGSGNTTTCRTGAPVNGLNGVIDMHGGREHVVALKSDGTVWTWGSNVEGQQARGTTANTLVPTRVTSLGSDNVAVETGHNHTVVLKSNGTVWAAGLNSDGQPGSCTDLPAERRHLHRRRHHHRLCLGLRRRHDGHRRGSGHTYGAADANTSSASVVVPATVQVGDGLVLVASANTAATQTTPAGWTLLGSAADGTEMRSSVWTRTAVAGVPGSTVRVPLSVLSKTNLSVVAYSGAGRVTTLASAVQGTANVTAHPAPAANVTTNGSTVLRYWSDKASSTRTWTTPSGVTRRTTTNGSGGGGGSLATFTADAVDVPAGSAAALNATSSLASAKAIAWTIVVPPA